MSLGSESNLEGRIRFSVIDKIFDRNFIALSLRFPTIKSLPIKSSLKNHNTLPSSVCISCPCPWAAWSIIPGISVVVRITGWWCPPWSSMFEIRTKSFRHLIHKNVEKTESNSIIAYAQQCWVKLQGKYRNSVAAFLFFQLLNNSKARKFYRKSSFFSQHFAETFKNNLALNDYGQNTHNFWWSIHSLKIVKIEFLFKKIQSNQVLS